MSNESTPRLLPSVLEAVAAARGARTGTLHPRRGACVHCWRWPAWDSPLTTLKNDITGPVAFTISLLGVVAAGAALVFGGEINEFTRRVMMLVLVVSFVVAATNFASALGITGGIV